MRIAVPELTFLLAVVALYPSSAAAQPSGWTLARSRHFEVYSQAGADRARAAAVRFEELKSFFDRNRLLPNAPATAPRPLRIIGFSSQSEYDAFKIRSMADAYFTGAADRDYIVMPMRAQDDFAVAAHEYAHFVLFSRGIKLPAWLNEGLPELFSTVRITDRGCEFGGPLPARVDTLRRRTWLSAAQLLAAEPDSPLRETRAGTSVFYAESWALTDMLTSSPEFAPRFADLIKMLNAGAAASQEALAAVYGKSLDAILREAKKWFEDGRSSRRMLPSLPSDAISVEVKPVSERQARTVTADLLYVNGQWARSEEIYRQLLKQSPADADLLASLGTVQLREGHRSEAAASFRNALDNHLQNATLCYRYALLADELDLPSAEIERALERTIALQPDADDARYKLALMKSNDGDYAAAISQLQSMPKPSGGRAFDYWATLAYDFSELDKREESIEAAHEAMLLAVTPEQRSRAAQLRYTAETDLAVRFTRDDAGKLQLTTTRVPHGAAGFNPFIEPGDRVASAAGKLKEINCHEGRLTGVVVESGTATLSLSIPDPLHVLITDGPSQFFCGPQRDTSVTVQYAAAAKQNEGVLRGMSFQ